MNLGFILVVKRHKFQPVTTLRLAICTKFSNLDRFHIICLFQNLLHFSSYKYSKCLMNKAFYLGQLCLIFVSLRTLNYVNNSLKEEEKEASIEAIKPQEVYLI